jgi:hypothetical protein
VSVSDNGLALTFKVDGESLTMTTPAGQSYSAKLDGTDAPYKGNSGINGVSVMRLTKGTIVETDKHDGKEVKATRLMIDPADTRTLEMIVTDSLRGTSTLLVAHKQSNALPLRHLPNPPAEDELECRSLNTKESGTESKKRSF